jgi:retinol dehydrogenase-13
MSLDTPSKKVAAVTGATGSIGKAIATQLAAHDFSVVLITRDPDKSTSAVMDIQKKTNNSSVHFRLVDMSRSSSIKELASNWEGPLHVLVNNAAIAPRAREETPEGIELQFATNVLGYIWMTNYFSTILTKSAPARVINVASYWAGGLNLDDLEFTKRPYHNHDAYRQSKQANRMLTPVFASMLQPKLITVNACHPGDVKSTLSSSLGFGGSQTPLDGAQTPVWLAVSPDVNDITGKYFENCRETHCQFGKNLDHAQRLFEICQTYP